MVGCVVSKVLADRRILFVLLALGTACSQEPDVPPQTADCTLSYTVSTYAGDGVAGFANGIPGRLNYPRGMAFDNNGRIYLADYFNHSLRAIAVDGTVSLLAGGAGLNGYFNDNGSSARFNFPTYLTLNSAGEIIVADAGNHCIRKVTSSGVVVSVTSTTSQGYQDGPVAQAAFRFPIAVACAADGSIYVADQHNHVIRRISSAGQVTTVAGTAQMSGLVDGPLLSARFNFPRGIKFDNQGRLLVADMDNEAIRRIDFSSGQVTTVAGGVGTGFLDGPALTARFDKPTDIAVDVAGNIYVCDSRNDRIRLIEPNRTVKTVAGSATEGLLNGPGNVAQFKNPYSIMISPAGDLYVGDDLNHVVRRITVSAQPTCTVPAGVR